MAADELLRFLVEALEREGIPYALAGSIAAMSYGEPRTTLDIDLVVALDPEAVTRLEDVFAAPDFYFDPQAARGAARTGGQFNVIHPSSGLKIDFFVVSDSIEESQIRRRVRRAVLPDLEAGFSPPEELIIKKLQYYAMGGSDKHLRDVASMLRISRGRIDLDRVQELAREHKLLDLWERLLQA